MTCKTPGCNNPTAPKRRICTVCRNRRNGELAKQRRRKERRTYGPCNEECLGWLDCTSRRPSDVRPLPCESLLPDEVGAEYEADSSPSYWVIPLSVSVNVGAM